MPTLAEDIAAIPSLPAVVAAREANDYAGHLVAVREAVEAAVAAHVHDGTWFVRCTLDVSQEGEWCYQMRDGWPEPCLRDIPVGVAALCAAADAAIIRMESGGAAYMKTTRADRTAGRWGAVFHAAITAARGEAIARGLKNPRAAAKRAGLAEVARLCADLGITL
jgi:hypothetical protein